MVYMAYINFPGVLGCEILWPIKISGGSGVRDILAYKNFPRGSGYMVYMAYKNFPGIFGALGTWLIMR